MTNSLPSWSARQAVLLWVAVRGVNLDEVLLQLRQVRLVWLIPVLASILVRFWLTAVRWQLLLRPVKRIAVHRLFAVTLIGFMANNVLPARLGEFVRAYALGRSEALPASLPFATIVIERIFDGFTLLVFLWADSPSCGPPARSSVRRASRAGSTSSSSRACWPSEPGMASAC